MPAIPGIPKDRSGTITVGATSQVAAAANIGRQYLLIQNIDAAEDLWVNFDTAAAAIAGAGSIQLKPAGSLVFEAGMGFVPTCAINVNATTLGHKFTCKEG